MTDLKQAAQLVKAGQRDEARKVVGALLKRDPDNDEAWYYAAMLSDAPEQRAKFLLKALDLNPFHERADAALSKLKASVGDDPRVVPARLVPTGGAKGGGSVGMIAAIAVTALLLIGMVAYGVLTLTRPQTAAPAEQVVPTSAALSAADFAATGTAMVGAVTVTDEARLVPTNAAPLAATPTPAPYQITSTAYLHIAQTADAELRLTATAAAGG
jgi:hypothetical protein